MHDWKDFLAFPEFAFARPIVREQARDARLASQDVRFARANEGIDLAFREECRERATLSLLDRDRPQQRRRVRAAVCAVFFDCALDPVDGREIDAELMGEMTARPDRGGLCIERQTHAL